MFGRAAALIAAGMERLRRHPSAPDDSVCDAPTSTVTCVLPGNGRTASRVPSQSRTDCSRSDAHVARRSRATR